jgi:hypothetical protein
MSLTRGDQEMDPISAASAGMLALGVPADRRAHALGLLAEMIDRADTKGRVEFNDAVYAIEQRLGVARCLDAYEWLEGTGVVRRTPTGWVIKAIAAHRGPAAATAASMAVIARHLEENAAESGVVREGALAPAAVSRGAAQLAEITPIAAARAKAAPSLSFARRVPVMAGSVAAAAALLLGLLTISHKDPITDQRGDLASRSGSLPAVKTPAAPEVVVGGVNVPVPSVVTGVVETPAVATVPGAPTPGGLACLLPQISVLSIDVVMVPNLLTGSTWTALVAGTVTNVSEHPATMDGVKILLDLGNGVVTEGSAVVSDTSLEPGISSTFSGIIAAGTARPENPSATVAATNWKSIGC